MSRGPSIIMTKKLTKVAAKAAKLKIAVKAYKEAVDAENKAAKVRARAEAAMVKLTPQPVVEPIA